MTVKKFWGLCLAITALAACGGGGGGDSASSGGTSFDPDPPTIIGGERPAKVELPSDYDAGKSYPLIILLHGFGANAQLQDAIFGFKDRIDDYEFVLVLPEGTVNSEGKQFWNAAPECCDFEGQGVDDVAYISSLIEEAVQLYPIDPERVFLAGHSNGGYMSYRMACDRPDLVKRIAVLAGSMALAESACAADRPVSALHMHGTADETVPYGPRDGEAGTVPVSATVGAEESIDRWARKAGCDEPPEAAGSRDFLGGVEGEETEIERWTGCVEGTRVELWRMVGGDHLLLDSNDDFRDAILDWLMDQE